MRNDLQSMNHGRACAQASHASNAFIQKNKNNKNVKEWQKQTDQGFGTVIILSASSSEINDLSNKFRTAEFPYDFVWDPEYAFLVNKEISNLLKQIKDIISIGIIGDAREDGMILLQRSEWTCFYVFGEKEKLAPFLENFPLYS